jgi:aryl-alcohol dehydrogenase-like predicted oxidoreductase
MGKAEIILGKAIKKFGWKQNDLVISTKVVTRSRIFERLGAD